MTPEELAATMTRPQRKGLRRAARGQSLSRTQSADLHHMKLLRAGQLTRRGHLTLNTLHHYEGATMTDQTIPADKVQEIIDMMDTRPTHPDGTSHHSEGYNEAVCLWNKHLRAILPATRTLADELRDLAADYDENGYPEPDRDLRALADRVETLEQERDELTYAREEGRAAADNWTNAAGRLEEAQAEITRLKAHEIPNGWRLADHEEYGRGIVTNTTPDSTGHVYFVTPNDALSLGYDWHGCPPAELTFPPAEGGTF